MYGSSKIPAYKKVDKMATVKVELSITLNTGNFSSIKATTGFEEGFEAIGSPEEISKAREAKFQELLEVCNDKLDEAVLAGIRKIKTINNKD